MQSPWDVDYLKPANILNSINADKLRNTNTNYSLSIQRLDETPHKISIYEHTKILAKLEK